MDARERGVAHWVFDLGRAAGLGTDTMPGAECLYVPLNGTRGPVGVLAVRPLHAGRPLTPDLLQLLEAFATQAGMAIESDRFADEARKAQLEVEMEKSRNALLNSVSHDLRTPLSAITGAASTLLEQDDRMPAAARRELAETISEEAAHLSRLVTNLLEMTRLESGAAKVKKEPCPIEEVVGSALTRMEKQLSGHPGDHAHSRRPAAGAARRDPHRTRLHQPAGERGEIHARRLPDRDLRDGVGPGK